MNDVVTPTPVTHLNSQGYIHGKLSTVLGAQFIQSAEWKQFTDSWNNLSQDGYMADGGTYRERRYSEFSYDTAAGNMSLLAHVPYSQTMEVNYLNGGSSGTSSPSNRMSQTVPSCGPSSNGAPTRCRKPWEKPPGRFRLSRTGFWPGAMKTDSPRPRGCTATASTSC